MIEFMSEWVETIIVGVVIITIIEMILPNTSNGKYVKLMGGIVVLMLIISPYINKSGSNVINIDKYISGMENETVETSLKIDNSEIIKKMYKENLQVDIKSKISEKGYVCGNVDVSVLNNEEYTIEKIDITIIEKKATNKKTVVTFVESIENVKVSLQNQKNDKKSVISESEIKKLKEYLSETYKVNQNIICIK